MEAIVKSNEIIKNFMGMDFNSPKYSPDVTHNNGKFDESWDWLMPVIQKIDEICSENDNAVKYLEAQVGAINYLFGDVVIAPNLNEVYVDVVDFIRAFNNGKF